MGYNAGSYGAYYGDPDDPLYDGIDEEEMYMEATANGFHPPGPMGAMASVPAFYAQYVVAPQIAQNENMKSREEKTRSQRKMMIETLKLLMGFLPDQDPHTPTGPVEEIRLYRLSSLFDRIAELLRNDSIIDITQRKELYLQVFTFVQVSFNLCFGMGLDWER